MYCKNCLYADFYSFDRKAFGYGFCNKLIALTIDNHDIEESELAPIEEQPLAFHHSKCEIGDISTKITIHPNFGCIEFRNS
jgi:hypothetical protein